MKILAILLLLALTQSTSTIEVGATGKSSVIVSSAEGLHPERKWKAQTFVIKNRGTTSFYVAGHSLNSVFVSVFTKNPKTQEWEDRHLGYCGTGAGFHEVKAGMSFSESVLLPIELADREFVIEFQRYASPTDRTGIKERTKPLRMN